MRRGRGGGRLGPLGLATPARIRFGALPPALPAISEDMANRRARRDEMTAQLNEDVFLAVEAEPFRRRSTQPWALAPIFTKESFSGAVRA